MAIKCILAEICLPPHPTPHTYQAHTHAYANTKHKHTHTTHTKLVHVHACVHYVYSTMEIEPKTGKCIVRRMLML